MTHRLFDDIRNWFKTSDPPLEDLKVEAALFLDFDPGNLANYHYFLEVRVIQAGDTPTFVQAVVCETNGEGPFTGTRKNYPPVGEGDPGVPLEKKGDVLHENFDLAISSLAQFTLAKPLIAVWTRSGRRFTAEVDRENIDRIQMFETEKAVQSGVVPPALGKAPILVAEDNRPDGLLIAEALKANAVENPVVIVSDGKELLDYLHRQGIFSEAAPAPCFILLDLNMPRVNGHEALKLIKSDPTLRDIPIIVLSGSRLEEDILKSYDWGATSYLTKPANFEGMVQAMRAIQNFWLGTARLPLGNGSQN